MPTTSDIGVGTSSANPATSVSMTTTAAVADGRGIEIVVSVLNDNPTAVAVTVAGVAATSILRSTRTGSGVTLLYGYKNSTGASLPIGTTISAAWTNTGTQNGGGAVIAASQCDSVVDPTTAAATGSSNAFNAAPTATTGAPPSNSKDYWVVTGLGCFSTLPSAGLATPPAGYTAFTEGYEPVRQRALYSAGKIATAPVGAQTVLWSTTWGGSKTNAEVVALFELAAAVPSGAAPGRMLTGMGV